MPESVGLEAQIRSTVITDLVSAVDLLVKQARRLRKASRKLTNKQGKIMYEVKMTSLWENEGEKSVTHIGETTLEETFIEAIKRFLEQNKRTDVQATYEVAALLEDGVKVPIPEVYWHQFKFRKLL